MQKTTIRNGVKFTDGEFTPQNISETTFDVNKRASKKSTGSGVKRKISDTLTKSGQKYVLDNIYEDLGIRRVDSDE